MRRLVYGVGTRLITSEGEPALDGVYKLVAVREGGKWMPAIKVSETPEKTLNPGHKLAWRLYDERGQGHGRPTGARGRGPARAWSASSCATRRTRPSTARSHARTSRTSSRCWHVVVDGKVVAGPAVDRADPRAPPRRRRAAGPGRAAPDQPAHLPRLAVSGSLGAEAAPGARGPRPPYRREVGGGGRAGAPSRRSRSSSTGVSTRSTEAQWTFGRLWTRVDLVDTPPYPPPPSAARASVAVA